MPQTTRSPAVLIVSNGGAEDLIGAALARALRTRGAADVRALPLVGGGLAYRQAAALAGPVLQLPSGGFPFGSAASLRADLKAGLVSTSLRQAHSAWRQGPQVGGVVVVGDSFALMLGALAARRVRHPEPGKTGPRWPLVHVQPLVSHLYAEGMGVADHLRELNALGANLFMPWELSLGRRAWRVYTRDAPTARHLAGRGVNAVYRGSFALDVLPAPERDLGGVLDTRPLLLLLPGGRGDARESLPLMLDAAALLPQLQPAVAWPTGWAEVPAVPGWHLQVQGEEQAQLSRGEVQVPLLRGAFSALLHRAHLAVGTAGTASEQAAGLGVPVVGFPTTGPQYTPGFARRQARLLGPALTLTAPSGQAISAALERLYHAPALYATAAQAGQERIGAAGAVPQIAQELWDKLSSGF